MTSPSLSLRGWLQLLCLACLWGGSFLANAVALTGLPVLTVVALRVLGGGLTLLVVMAAMGLRPPGTLRPWLGILGMSLFNNLLPFTLIVWGQQHIASGLASILNAGTAIWGVLIAALVLADERLTARRLGGVLVGFAGVVTVVGPASLVHLDPRSLGQWAIVAATVCYGLSGTWGRVFLRGVPPQVSAALSLTVSALVLLPVALWHDGVPDPVQPAPVWAAVAYLGVGASALAYLLFYRLLASAGAGNTGLVTLLIPPVAILLGAVVLDETLDPRAVLGFAVLALGLLILDGRLLRRRR